MTQDVPGQTLRDRRTGSRAVREPQTFILRSYELGVYIAYQKGGDNILISPAYSAGGLGFTAIEFIG
jgi:hypothetical protein